MRKDTTQKQVAAVAHAKQEAERLHKTGDTVKMGRPAKLDDTETVRKVYEGALLGLNDRAICLYSGVSVQTFYRYIKTHPDMREEIDRLREDNHIHAMRAVKNGLTSKDKRERGTMARWYLERTDERFSARERVDVATDATLTISDREEAMKKFLSSFRNGEKETEK